ncbi:hypothetical protein L1887_63060 [Cichorium endivia]|nr:hypothetical protein L1887_63060 [Cichorium endivia]
MYNQPSNLYHFLDNNKPANGDFYSAHPQIVDYGRSIGNSDLMKASSSKFCSICGDNALHMALKAAPYGAHACVRPKAVRVLSCSNLCAHCIHRDAASLANASIVFGNNFGAAFPEHQYDSSSFGYLILSILSKTEKPSFKGCLKSFASYLGSATNVHGRIYRAGWCVHGGCSPRTRFVSERCLLPILLRSRCSEALTIESVMLSAAALTHCELPLAAGSVPLGQAALARRWGVH